MCYKISQAPLFISRLPGILIGQCNQIVGCHKIVPRKIKLNDICRLSCESLAATNFADHCQWEHESSHCQDKTGLTGAQL